MKYSFKEHPQIFLFLISLIMLGISIWINILYNFAVYAVILLVLAGIATVVLGFSFFYDLYLFFKNNKE